MWPFVTFCLPQLKLRGASLPSRTKCFSSEEAVLQEAIETKGQKPVFIYIDYLLICMYICTYILLCFKELAYIVGSSQGLWFLYMVV